MGNVAVPGEVWLKVFKEAGIKSIPSIIATDRLFSRIARPLLFANFDLLVCGILGGRGTFYERSPVKHAKALARLAFFSTPEVARYVRTCHVSTWAVSNPKWAVSNPLDCVATENPLLLFEVFLHHVENFTRMKKLVLKIEITGAHLSRLYHALPALEELEANADIIEPWNAVGSGPPLKHLSLTLSSSFTGFRLWTPFLNSHKLECVDIDCMFMRNFTNVHPHDIPRLPNVSRLTLRVTTLDQVINFSPLLTRFPAVKVLTIGDGRDVFKDEMAAQALEAGCDSLFHTVEELYGTHLIIGIFMRRAENLTRITLNTLPTPHEFYSKLGDARPFSRITYVSLDISGPTARMLSEILWLFPQLENLIVDLAKGFRVPADSLSLIHELAQIDAGSERMARAIKGIFPSTLRRVMISLLFWGGHYRDAICPLQDVRDGLVDNLPNISAIWVDNHDHALMWRRSPSNSSIEPFHGAVENIGRDAVRSLAGGFREEMRTKP
ncbi:hypothetical protein MIND_00005400 [Mycena indigotica]|uniref:Uncharacterized protein n=1 Tax=Mycena indigotica TaxID=2126181 RepID=A0A8H6TA07_9AGAR|nr:uncharacterized protein MIND_00005400 [Mycena indigotica]KAF7314915.1 hypothetical protein MIND_00005400 [Mycena indigotica]